MATEAAQSIKISLEAAADLSASQYMFVKRDGNGRAVAVAAATDQVIGVLQNKPKALGQMAEVTVTGLTKLVVTSAGTAFTTPTDFVAPDTTGKGQKATPTGMGGAYVQGTKQALGQVANIGSLGLAAPAAGDVTRVLVNCTTPVPAT